MTKLRCVFVAAFVAAAGCSDSSTALPPDTGVVADSGTIIPDAPPSIPDTSPVPDASPPKADLGVPPDGPTPPPAPTCMTGGTPCTDFVISRLVLPTATSASSLGHDLDGDKTVDNALGRILGAVAGFGTFDMQGSIDQQVYSGQTVQLARVAAKTLVTEPKAVMQLWPGRAETCCTSPTPVARCLAEAKTKCFNGTKEFQVSPLGAKGSALAGAITSGSMLFGPGTMKLSVPLLTAKLVVTLRNAKVSGKVTKSGVTSGILAGAIHNSEVQSSVIPEMAKLLDTLGSSNALILGLFDTNKDGKIDAKEVAANSLIKNFLAPDIDLDKDGNKDALSLGIGFTAAAAKIKTK